MTVYFFKDNTFDIARYLSFLVKPILAERLSILNSKDSNLIPSPLIALCLASDTIVLYWWNKWITFSIEFKKVY